MDLQSAVTPEEIWTQAFLRVQRVVDVPTVWLAMEAARPLALDGNHLIVGMALSDQYLRVNLQTHEYATAIEDALAAVAGRPLALHIIEGYAISDYYAEQAQADAAIEAPSRPAPRLETYRPEAAPEHPAPQAPSASASQPSRPRAAEGDVEIIPNWDRLNDRLTTGFKRMPLARYPHGQASFVLYAVRMISATMDELMDAPFGKADPMQERHLAKCIERLGVTVSLDPFFISLELIRYRREIGRDIGVIPPS